MPRWEAPPENTTGGATAALITMPSSTTGGAPRAALTRATFHAVKTPNGALAKAAADLTCSYANAVPQVPAFNRATMGYNGQWGQLEKKLLEAGREERIRQERANLRLQRPHLS